MFSSTRDTVERELTGCSKVSSSTASNVARRQAAQERANHQRLERVGPGHVLAQQPRLEAEPRRVRTRGHSSSTVPNVVLTLRGS
jgi:hypothetical protein